MDVTQTLRTAGVSGVHGFRDPLLRTVSVGSLCGGYVLWQRPCRWGCQVFWGTCRPGTPIYTCLCARCLPALTWAGEAHVYEFPEPFGPRFRTRTRQASFFAVSLCLWMEFFSIPLSPPKLYVFQGSSFRGHACVLFYVNFRSLFLS